MSNEVVTPNAEPITPVVTPAAPIAEVAPVPSPVVREVPTPVVPANPEVPVADGVDPPVAETLLGEAEKPKEVKTTEVTADTTKPAEEKTEEVQSEEPAPTPVYDQFTLPEGFSTEGEQVKKFTDLLSDLEVNGKADHALLQEFGQKAVDMYTTEVKTAVENLQKLYNDTWTRTKLDWKESFLKDPEIGGNRFQTSVDSANSFIRMHGGTEDQQAEFRNLMNTTGIGNHPAMIRLLAKAGTAMSEGTPLAASKPVAPPKSKTSTLYGKSE